MQTAIQFSVFLVNKPGVLAQVTKALAQAKINILALTLVDSSEHGVLRLVSDDPDKLRQALRKAHDFTETEVLQLSLANEPGAFADAAERLATDHININYAYATGGAPGGHTTAIFKVADLKKALRVLKLAGGSGRKQGRGTIKVQPRR
jgi:hypothetical protein